MSEKNSVFLAINLIVISLISLMSVKSVIAFNSYRFKLVEGDIVQKRASKFSAENAQFKLNLWPHGVIYYEIDKILPWAASKTTGFTNCD